MRTIAFVTCILFGCPVALGWLESGHHVVAVAAFDSMSESDRSELLRILAEHPQYELHFAPPENLNAPESVDRWRFGTAGYWPDIIRGTDYDRPTWHYQRAANYLIGNVELPDPPGQLPRSATLETQELHIAQAVDLCLKVFHDTERPDSDRAIALCWLVHLFADGHLPCHAGSLYEPNLFPDGDRGANLIKIPNGNLHFAWDSLLGQQATPGDVRRRVLELRDIDIRPPSDPTKRAKWISAETWLSESDAVAKTHLYTDEVTGPIIAASRKLTDGLPELRLSDAYFRNANAIAKRRAKLAALRLAEALANPPRD